MNTYLIGPKDKDPIDDNFMLNRKHMNFGRISIVYIGVGHNRRHAIR